MDNEIIQEMNNAFQTAFIDSTNPSNLALKPQFVSNNYKEGKKVLSSIEDELLSCDHFKISVAFITMSGITPLLMTFKELEKRGVKGEILTTDYLSFSDPKALNKLHSLSNLTIRMFDTEAAGEGFHTKGYIFRDEKISERAKEIFEKISPAYNITLEEWNYDKDHVHILFRAHPKSELSKFINAYKSASSRLIKKEYPEIRNKLWKEYFWSHSFCLLTTGVAPLEVIKKYIETQGSKGK